MFKLSTSLSPVLALSCILSSGCAVSLGVEVGEEHSEWEEEHEHERDEDDSAKLKHRLAELEAASSITEAEASLKGAEAELMQAHKALEVFNEGAAQDRRREAELDVERSRVQLDEQRATLAQLESDYSRYGDDELAKQTADIVLNRHRARVRFEEVELELAERALWRMRELELPMERAELEAAVESAEAAVLEAHMAVEMANIQRELDMREVEEELEREHDEDHEDDEDHEEDHE